MGVELMGAFQDEIVRYLQEVASHVAMRRFAPAFPELSQVERVTDADLIAAFILIEPLAEVVGVKGLEQLPKLLAPTFAEVRLLRELVRRLYAPAAAELGQQIDDPVTGPQVGLEDILDRALHERGA